MPLNGRSAVVTGAGRGLGEAIARALHARGAEVVVADLDGESAERVASSLGERARADEVDVRDRVAIERLLAAGRVDILVNNAARTVSRSIWEIDEREWDDILATNLRSVFFGCQLAGPRMRDHGWGRIVNMSSLAGQAGGTVSGAHYAASKAGIIVLTKIVAQELAPHGVTCNALAPAAIRTPVMDDVPAERLEQLRQRIPVARFGEAGEVAELTAFLCSDEAGYVTGATFDINGGLRMR